ncbi:hypothetical protein [Methanosarcina sp. KYL-1]|nr:hypothetical protein [Methanosarcina sp. KYL-1]
MPGDLPGDDKNKALPGYPALEVREPGERRLLRPAFAPKRGELQEAKLP